MAVTLGLAEPVVAAVLGVVVLGERLTATAIVGLVLVGLALATWSARRRRSAVGSARRPSPPG